MSYRLTMAVLLFLGIMTGSQLFAQSADTTQQSTKKLKSSSVISSYRTWSVGIYGGISTPYVLGVNNKQENFTSPDIQTSFGGYIKDQISRSFGLQADFFTGNLKGDHSIQLNSSNVPIYSQFDTKLNWSTGLSANLEITHTRKGFVQSYIIFGGGLLSYTPVLHSYYSNSVVPTFNTSTGFYIPLGVGLKFKLAKGINLDLAYQVNFFSPDNLEGYSYVSNNSFSYTHIGLELALGDRAKPQLAMQKKIPPMHVEHIAPARILKTPVVVQSPPIDSALIRHDQLKRDLDSTNARLARLNLDSDGDGVPDVKDKCPNTPAGTKVDSTGCPIVLPVIKPEIKSEVKEEDRTTVKMAIQNLEFFPGTSIIHGYSLNGLDKVADLLKSKKLKLRLEGYTDSAGKPGDNLKLSKERAEAVKLYLVGRGVNAAQIETVGYGAAHPVASNKTAAGRRLNRRVEFILL